MTKKRGVYSNKKTKKQCISNKEGERVPNITFRTRVSNLKIKGPNKFKWKNLKSLDVFKKKRVVVLALPGAYTPTCSSTHLPGYEYNYDKIKKLGIDEIYVLSVNDAFVMYNWCKKLNIKKVKFLPDGNGDFTKKMGALVKKNNLGFGNRSWRYSMVVNDGIIEKLFSEDGKMNNCKSDPFKVSDAKTMLKYLKNNI
jgi:thioredoxin-dependent peroxiredoxin